MPLILSLFLMFRMEQLTTAQLKYSFWAFAVSFGISLSLIFSVFTAASIVQSLLITTVSFGALAGWGYFTRRDLTSMGGFLFAGVIALILIGLFNIWFGSSLLQTIINVLAVGIFLGLTAYDMQQIRNQLWASDSDLEDRIIVIGALSLFINYINIFVNLVQLLGNRE
jgi:FtsH-binding integral membrane protein